MAAMRRVQPEMKSIQERFKDDRPAQQQAMMELYKKEKINPLSGCWPILIQIPVFFALYTVIFISLDMRHAPFFGWIQDLAAPDPTNIFTLFGLIPWNPIALPIIGSFLHLGIWPLIMGITMWVQMKLNPPPPDPTPGDDLQLDADHLHLHARHLPGRPRDLLGLEQHAVGDPAVFHHEAPRRRGEPASATSSTASSASPSPKTKPTPQTIGQTARRTLAGSCLREAVTMSAIHDAADIDRSRTAAVRAAVRVRQGLRADRRPAADRPGRDRLCRPLQCRQVVADQCAARHARRWRAPRTRRAARRSSTSSRARARRCASSTCPAMAMPRRPRTRSRPGPS